MANIKEIDCERGCPNPNCDADGSDITYGTYELEDGKQWKQHCDCQKCGLYFTAWYNMVYDNTSYNPDDLEK